MCTWRGVRNFASQKFPLTPAHQIPCIFFKHLVSNCGQQCNRIGCWLSLVDLIAVAATSCKQRYKGLKMVLFYVIIVIQNILSTFFCIDYENPLYPALQWPGSREFGLRVKTFGYPCSSAGVTNVVPVGTRSPEGPCKSPAGLF